MKPLRNGVVINAKFTANVVELDSIEIRFRSKGNNNGAIFINVYDDVSGKKIGSWIQDISELRKEQIISYPFDHLGYEGSRQKNNYRIEMIAPERFNRVSVALTKDNNDSNTEIDGEVSKHGLQFAVAGVSDMIPLPLPRFWMQMYICIILAVLIIKIESVSDIIKKNKRSL